jgi:uncharacterized protein (DUF58 family)
MTETGSEPEAWAPTRALGRAILFAGVLIFAATLVGRVDLVLLAAPFALGTALSLRRRPRGVPRVALSTEEPFVAEGGETGGAVTVSNPDPVPLDLALVRVQMSPWLRVRHGDRPFAAVVPAGESRQIALHGPAARWGRHQLGPALTHGVACDGLFVSEAGLATPRIVKVYPVAELFEADEAMPRAAGLIGGHRSRQPGEGGELAGVRQFGPGDRLRRIDWRVTLRTRELHVAATLSDRDAEVVLLLDVLHEAGTSGGIGGPASVLDTTVRAVAAISEHYLKRGDRVSLLEYGFRARRLRPASGRRQYVTVLEWLLDVQATDSGYEPTAGTFGTQLLSANALVIVLTPLLDQRSAAMIARLARSGRFVFAVDTLTADVRTTRAGQWSPVAHRIWRLERENTIGQLREHGVPVVRWAGTGSLDEVLRAVSRRAAIPRGVLR